MPFQERCAYDEAIRFVSLWRRGGFSMTQLCARFSISRTWGYELVRRYEREGPAGLQARSRAPKRSGRAMAPDAAEAIVALRCEWPRWGPKKLRAYLRETRPEVHWPAASTIGDLLKRAGLVDSRRRRGRIALTRPFARVGAANDLWTIDFKGWFCTGEGRRCDPLTLVDAHCRYLLDCRIVHPVGAAVDAVVERALREHGLPHAIRSDNGPPFAGTGAGGLTRLAVKWIKLGIALERCDPGAPQQNGRHERLHATLKADTAAPPAATMDEQQARFDRFRESYNTIRPHEALGQTPPARHYTASPRPYPHRPVEPDYPAHHAVRKVRSNGEIKWRGERIYVSQAVIGEPVGLAQTETGDWIVSFHRYPLGQISRKTAKLKPFTAIRPGTARRRKQNEKTVSDVSGL